MIKVTEKCQHRHHESFYVIVIDDKKSFYTECVASDLIWQMYKNNIIYQIYIESNVMHIFERILDHIVRFLDKRW